MFKKFGIGILIFCFGLSDVDAARATQVVEVAPIIVQPDDLRDISDQMMAQDRINRDQELAIRGLIDDNQKLTDTALARQQDATLEKINQTMINYRNSLIYRDRARIVTESQKHSKYYDLITLTEDVDDIKGVGQTLQLKNDVIEEKYKILTELRDEMMALNEKLKGHAVHGIPETTSLEQENKIRVLAQNLGEMDQKIARYDEVLAQKDQQIAQLKYQIADLQRSPKGLSSFPAGRMALPPIFVNTAAKYDAERWLKLVLAVNKLKAKYYKLSSEIARTSLQQAKEEGQVIPYDSFKSQVKQLGLQLSQKQAQVDLLKSELENKISAPAQADDRIVLAKQLIHLQQQEAVLLDEKSRLLAVANTTFEQQSMDHENKMKALITNHQIQNEDLRNRMQELKSELVEKQQQVDRKTAESNRMNMIVEDYQKKLESKDNAYNEQLGQSLSSQNDQARLESQIAVLNSRLQEKEAQVIKIKKDLYDLQEINSEKDRDLQAKDLSLSMIQQKAMDDKINALLATKDKQMQEITNLKSDLALAQQQLKGMPSSDEVEYLRSGLKNEDLQLKQKDEMLLQIKANADEYAREFKAQSLEFQSLKVQLQSAYQEIHFKNEALKFRDLEITHLKEHAAVGEGDLQDQVKALTQKLEAARKQLVSRPPQKNNDEMLLKIKTRADEYAKEYKAQSLEFQSLKSQLQDAKEEISRKNEDLKYKNMEITRLKQRSKLSKELSNHDIAGEKLKQALDKIDQQGRLINVLAQKLQDAGQSVNLSQQ